jgi:flagellar hook-basal body complex protein FliE
MMTSIQNNASTFVPLQSPSMTTGSLNSLNGPNSAGDAGSFKSALLKSIGDVNSMQMQADQAVETLMTGGDADPAAVLTAVQKADLAFRMMMQMRNKVMQVYQEVKDIRI